MAAASHKFPPQLSPIPFRGYYSREWEQTQRPRGVLWSKNGWLDPYGYIRDVVNPFCDCDIYSPDHLLRLLLLLWYWDRFPINTHSNPKCKWMCIASPYICMCIFNLPLTEHQRSWHRILSSAGRRTNKIIALDSHWTSVVVVTSDFHHHRSQHSIPVTVSAPPDILEDRLWLGMALHQRRRWILIRACQK